MYQFLIFIVLIAAISAQNESRIGGRVLSYKPPRELQTNIPPAIYTNKKEESARKFLQKYQRTNPVVILVENNRQSHQNAINFLKNVHKLNPDSKDINFMLMKFNTSGVTNILETTQNNNERLIQLLGQESEPNPSATLGRQNQNRSAVFFAILNAVPQLPQNGGIIIFMKRPIEDEALALHAEAAIRRNRIQVFVIWGGLKATRESLLEELANLSGGTFLISPNSGLSQQHQEQFLQNLQLFTSVSTILSRRNLKGEHNLHFPVDSDVTAIHISIAPGVTSGILTTAGGYKIDLLEDDVLAQYAVGSFVDATDLRQLEIHLNTTAASSQDIGVWRLRVKNARAYNITIFAHSKLTTEAVVVFKNATDPQKGTGSRRKVMKLGIGGDISLISNISFVNEDGLALVDNAKFTLGEGWEASLTEHIGNIETTENKQVEVDVEQIPKEPFYAVINGKDAQGNDFTRLSYVRKSVDNDLFHLPPLTIDVGLGSELITQPNRQPQVFFEVTNNGNRAVLTRFYCSDERSILLSMTPWYKWISPQETATVRVTLTTRPGSYRDLITFTAVASDTREKKVIVDVGTTNYEDRQDPELDWQFTSNCLGVLLGSCEDGTWTVEVKAKDTRSGLLQVSSKPSGLHFPNGFTTGTNEEVTGYFSESCCNPDLQIVAVDRENNRRTYNINAYRANWGPGAIAALILGILLIILIIIAIVYAIRKCPWPCPRKKESYDLPTYRGPTTKTSSRRL